MNAKIEHGKCEKSITHELEVANEFAFKRSTEGQIIIGRLIQDFVNANILPEVAFTKIIWTCGTILASGVANFTNVKSDWRFVLTDDIALKQVETQVTQVFRDFLASIVSGESNPVGGIDHNGSISVVSSKSGNA